MLYDKLHLKSIIRYRFLKSVCYVQKHKVICAPYTHDVSYLSPDSNTVLYISGDGRFPIFPASESDSRVVTPFKQPLSLPVIKSNPKLISGYCRDGQYTLSFRDLFAINLFRVPMNAGKPVVPLSSH